MAQMQRERKGMVDIDFGPTPDILKEEHFNVYKEIWSEIVNTTRSDENSDLSTTYLEKIR